MKKFLLFSALFASLYAGEFDFGKGKFNIKGGFLGLNSEKSADVMSFTLAQQHKNLFSTKWFYKYNITWYESNDVKNAQQTIETYSRAVSSTLTVPATDYKFQGVDANLILGRDLYKKKDSFLGIGVLLGISIPWIESKEDSDNDSTTSTLLSGFEKSKTKIMTYKIGLNLTANKDFNKYFGVYLSGSYAYQTGYVKNNYANVDTSVNGSFKSFEANIRFTPFSYKKKIWIITFSPKLYFTAGYRYSKWIVKDLAIDVTGNDIEFSKSDLKMSTNIGYLGVGYSF